MTSTPAPTSTAVPGSPVPVAPAVRKKAETKRGKPEPPVIPVVQEVIITPFDKLVDVWTLPSATEQRKKVAEIFGYADAPGVCYESILVDNLFENAVFCHRSSFTKGQTKAFFGLMSEIQACLTATPAVSLEQCVAKFRSSLLAKTSSSDAPTATATAQTAATTTAPAPSTTATAPAAVPEKPTATVSKAAPERKGQSQATSKAATTTTTTATAPAVAASADPSSLQSIAQSAVNTLGAAVSDLDRFNVEQARVITEFVTSGVFTHYALYQAVFNKSFERRKRTVQAEVLMEAPLLTIAPLSQGEEVGGQLRVMIVGPPAAGKGTQCERIKKEYGLFHISTGDLLREEVKNKTELGVKASEFMNKGALVPDQLIITLVKNVIRTHEVQKRGWLLDGFPRTEGQAQALIDAGVWPQVVLVLNVNEASLVDRVTGRRLDPVTGEIYHIRTKPPPADVAARVIHRADDTQETIVKRLAAFNEHKAAVEALYGRMLHRIDGNQPPDGVWKDVKACLDKQKDFEQQQLATLSRAQAA